MNQVVKRTHFRRSYLALPFALVILSLACSMPGRVTPTPTGGPAAPSATQPAPARPTGTPLPLPPAVIESHPPQGAEVPLQGPLTLFFNQAMDRASVESGLRAEVGKAPLQGDFTWINDATLSLHPRAQLAPDMDLVISLSSAKTAAGIPLAQPVRLAYRTTGYLVLTQELPEAGAQEVDPSGAVVAAFNRPVVPLGADPASLPQAFSLKLAGDAPGEPSGKGEWLNTSTYSFHPDPPLAGGQEYQVMMNPALQGTDGAPLQEVEIWTFTTARPRLVSLLPPPDSRFVPLDSSVVLSFSQPMDQASVESNFSLTPKGGAALAGVFAWSDQGTVITFTPGAPLVRDTDYTLLLNSQAQGRGGTPLTSTLSTVLQTVPAFSVLQTDPVQGGTKPVYADVAVSFTSPVQENDVLNYFSFSPALTISGHSLEGDGRTLHLYADFAPGTAYSLRIAPELPDRWGTVLGQEYLLSFQTAPLDPAFNVLTGSDVLFLTPQDASLTALATNISSVPLAIGRISLDEFTRLAGSEGYDLRQSYRPVDEQSWEQAVTLPADQAQRISVYLSQDQAPLAPGIYFLRFNFPDTRIYASPFLLVVSSLQQTFKLSTTDALVWAVDLRSGAAAANLPVSLIREDGSQLASGQTGADGVLQQAIRLGQDPYSRVYSVIGQPGEELFSLASSGWSQGIASWDFGIPADYAPPETKVYLYTERPVYRPGQTVYFRGVIRQADNGRYHLPVAASLPITLTDGMGKSAATFNLPLSAFGTAHGEYALPADAAPGIYTLNSALSLDTSLAQAASFQVANYRKPEINVIVDMTGADQQMGEMLEARIQANYFFGAPAGDAALHWALYARPFDFVIPGYQVGPVDNGWLDPFPYPRRIGEGLGMVLQEGDGRTAADGTFALSLPTAADAAVTALKPGQPYIFTLEATVKDESGLPVSARDQVNVHAGEFYIGLRPDQWVLKAGEQPVGQAGFDVLSVNWQNQPAGALALRAEFSKVTWVEADADQGYPEGGKVLKPQVARVASTDFVTSDQGQARLAFTPEEPGNYQLSVFDPAQPAGPRSEILLWVGGPGTAAWPNLPNQRLRLTLNNTPVDGAFQAGETAEIFIPNPFSTSVSALVTVERGRVMRYQTLVLDAQGMVYSLPLGSADAPNVYLSITLLGKNSLGNPDFRQGYQEVRVKPLEFSLNAVLSSDRQQVGPGEPVILDLLVTDQAGAPVEGEFSLAVVDQAALALAEPNAPDILPAFYNPQPLSVRTSQSLAAYGNRLMALPAGRGGGGGAELQSTVVRDRFPDTAYWSAVVTTGPDGRARVSVPLPDTLTTWVVDVRGITTDSRVGQARLDILATKDLLIRPVTPRFLVAGDHVRLSAVVQNNTADALQAEVTLQSTGFSLDQPAQQTQQVSVPAGGRAPVEWWGTAQQIGSIDLVFAVQAGSLQDMARPAMGALPVLKYLTPQAFRTSGVMDQAGESLELVSLPPEADVQEGGLALDLAPSLAAAVMDSLDVLEHYPYECTEQTLSRFLPNMETYRVMQKFNRQADVLKARLDRTLYQGLERLAADQNPDGGWSWWPQHRILPPEVSRSISDPYISAYVLYGLLRAQQAGAAPDVAALERGIEYLKSSLPDPSGIGQEMESWELDRLAFETYVLSGQGEDVLPALLDVLYQRRDELNPWGQAFLALALEQAAPGDGRAQTLISDLSAAATRSATGALWELGEDSRVGSERSMVSTQTNSAMVLYALAQAAPRSPLLAEAVRSLMSNRQADGSWDSTYTTAWALIALADVMEATGELAGDFNFSASLNNAPLAEGHAAGSEALNPVTASAPMSSLYPDNPNALVIRRDGGQGRLYYTAALNLSLPAENAPAIRQGMSVERAIYPFRPAASGQESCLESGCQALQEAQAGQKVTVRLALSLPRDAYYVALEDYIPAGAEIQDPNLKTSEMGEGGAPGAQLEVLDQNSRAMGWGTWLFHPAQVYDTHITWMADYLPAGTYELTYTLLLNQPGEYRLLPARAWEFYFPEVRGATAGSIFRITQ